MMGAKYFDKSEAFEGVEERFKLASELAGAESTAAIDSEAYEKAPFVRVDENDEDSSGQSSDSGEDTDEESESTKVPGDVPSVLLRKRSDSDVLDPNKNPYHLPPQRSTYPPLVNFPRSSSQYVPSELQTENLEETEAELRDEELLDQQDIAAAQEYEGRLWNLVAWPTA